MSRRSKVEWSVILKELATSGQRRAQFAATRGIPLATLVYQLSRQRRRAASEVSRTPAFVILNIAFPRPSANHAPPPFRHRRRAEQPEGFKSQKPGIGNG